MLNDRDFVMYHGTVRRLPFVQQVRAAALLNCGSITIGPYEYRQMTASGVSARSLSAIAADAGVRVTHLDPFVRWVSDWMPEEVSAAFPIEALNCDEDELYAIANALELRSFTVAACFPPGRMPISGLVDAFGALCDRAARHGLRCDMEFVPFSAIVDLDVAWKIVRGAGADNGGIMFDFWHYMYSHSSPELLRSIPGERITGVQINDGDAVPPAGMSFIDAALSRRKPLGEGSFPIAEILAVLHDIGGLNRVGPEIFATEFDSLSAQEIAARCRPSLDRIAHS